MRDIKGKEWARAFWTPKNFTINLAIKSKEIFDAVAAYDANMLRALTLAGVPQMAFTFGMEYQLGIVAARMQLTGKPAPDYVRVVDPNAKPAAPIESAPPEIIAQWKKYLDKSEKPPFPIVASVTDDETWDHFNLPVFLELHDQLELLMNLQVAAAWTAVETLAGDMWESALNARPEVLAKNFKKVSILAVIRCGATNVGTIIREDRKGGDVSLQTMDGIQSAYDTAFKADREWKQSAHDASKRIHNALKDQSLTDLAMARNVIVHRAGKCDREYEERWHGGSCLPENGATQDSAERNSLSLSRFRRSQS